MAAKKAEKEEVQMIGTKELADQLGTKPATLRRFLRTLPANQDNAYTRYKWAPGDKFLKDVEKSFEKYKASEKEKNAERLKGLKEKEASKKGTDKKAPAKASKKAKKEEVDEEAEELA